MKFLVSNFGRTASYQGTNRVFSTVQVVILFVAVASCAPAVENSIRGSHKFQDRPGKLGDQNGTFKGEYQYVDENGFTHFVKYLAGPKTGFQIVEDKIQYQEAAQKSFQKPSKTPYYNSILSDVKNSVVKIHHIRNEVPATVHRTSVPKSVHAMAPPPVFSRRFIDIHELPVYI